MQHRRRIHRGFALTMALAAGLGLCAASAASFAADPAVPDLRGTWKVEGEAIVTGAGGHHPGNAEPKAEGNKPRLRKFDATLTITGQEGVRFWGTLSSPAQTEDIIGTFTGDGGRFVAVDSDGYHSGEALASGSIHDCYQQADPTYHVAACWTATRE